MPLPSNPLTTIIPALNHIRFYPTSEQPSWTNFIHPDNAAYYDSIQYWQTKYPYLQKIQIGDRITIMLHVQQNTGSGIVVVNFYSINSPTPIGFTGQSISIPNNIDPDTGAPLDSWLFSTPTAGLTTIPGIYYFTVTNTNDVGSSAIFYSELINIQEIHPKTIRIDYGNNTNKDWIFIDGWFSIIPKFALRIEGDIRKFNPYSNTTTYKDQQFNEQNLKTATWRSWMFKAGSATNGIPEYMIDKLSQIFGCDNIKIDNKPFIYDNESSGSGGSNQGTGLWSIQGSDNAPLKYASIPITETENTYGITFRKGAKLIIYISPGAYPYAISPWQVKDALGFVTYANISDPYIINASSDETTYAIYLNNEIAVNNDLAGIFAYENIGGNLTLVYNEDASENFSIRVPYVLDVCFSMKVNGSTNIVTAGNDFPFAITGGITVTDWGDGGLSYYKLNSGVQQALDYVYSSSTTLTNGIRLFFKSDISIPSQIPTALIFEAGSGGVYVSDIGGVIPELMTSFEMYGQNFSGLTTLDLTPIYNSHIMQKLGLGGNGIKGFSAALILSFWRPTLNYIDISNNELSAASVDAAFNSESPLLFQPIFGYFTTKFQTPTAPPTSASATIRTGLAATFSWTILTD